MSARTVVSLFAGAGGSSMGYILAGYKPRLAVEWDKHAVACYALNFPHTPLYVGDVGALTDVEALRLAGLAPGELDVLDGSPPCQGFSTAGARKLTDDRNTLFLEYVRLLRAFKPRAFVMENVPGIALGKMKLVFLDVMKTLREVGYNVRCAVLDASAYGVPQVRRRAIFIGFREDLGIAPQFPAPTHTRGRTVAEALSAHRGWLLGTMLSKAPDNSESAPHGPAVLAPAYDIVQPTGKDAGNAPLSSGMNAEDPPIDLESCAAPTLMRLGIAGSRNSQAQVSLSGFSPMSSVLPAPPLTGKALAVAQKLQQGQRGSDILDSGSWHSTVKLDASDSAPTMCKTGGLFNKYPSVQHPVEVRGLSVGEVMRLQSFPDDYRWPDGTTWAQGWARVGNSVPPLMMRAIAACVADSLLDSGSPR